MPKVEPTPDGRDISIPSRQAKFRNLNSKPEQHGAEKEPRNDLSLEFTLSADQAADVIDYDGNLDQLWNKDGEPRFTELADPMPLSFRARGIAKIGPARGDLTEFDATLKKVAVLFEPERKVTVFAQVRIDPTGHTEWLTKAECAGLVKFGFKGKVLVKSSADEESEDEPQLPLTTNGNGAEQHADPDATNAPAH